MSDFCIVVAGGRGLRMGADLPKQFLPIGGRPVLMHTLEAFKRAVPGIQIILVLPHDQQAFWRELCAKHNFTLPHSIADGGATRFHSVLSGLRSIAKKSAEAEASASEVSGKTDADAAEAEADAIVAVHDGVRPFVAADVIQRCFTTAAECGTAIPVMPVVETVRELCTPQQSGEAGDSVTRDRSRFRLVQTPQVFSLNLLRKAYEQPYSETFTDDASVVEALGRRVALVEGNRENIKITTPFDLTIAEAYFSREVKELKI